MKQEKIKEILSQDKYNNLRGVRLVEKVLQEYGQWVRQQTLEEAIESLPRDRFGSFNECKDIVLSNLQALKDKN